MLLVYIEVSGNFYGRLLCVDISMLTFYMCPLDRAIIDYIYQVVWTLLTSAKSQHIFILFPEAVAGWEEVPTSLLKLNLSLHFFPQLELNRIEHGKPFILVFV